MTPTNPWTTHRRPLARWIAELPPVAEVGPEALLGFVGALMDEGAEQAILVPTLAGAIGPPEPVSRDDLLTRLRSAATDHQPLLSWFARPPAGQRWGLRARVATFDALGELAEVWTEDAGALRRALPWPACPEALAAPPLELRSPAVPLSPHHPQARWPVEIAFTLKTDLWFPRVLGLDHTGPLPASPFEAQARDNAALAARHTPRLNALLEAAADHTRFLGGRWYLDDVGDRGFYRPLCHDTGVHLR